MNATKEQLNKIVALSKFRVKIKSLAEEARIIRHEERKRRGVFCSSAWGNTHASDALLCHRVCVVRPEQRHTLLAYAFLRGKRYSSVEKPSEGNKPNVSSIVRILKSLAWQNESPGRIQAWLAG